MTKKVIICNGDAHTPPRFWGWIVCTEDEFTEKHKSYGWVESQTAKYLNLEQLAYLKEC